jgi:membrane protease YdiL (CAAX protease family)
VIVGVVALACTSAPAANAAGSAEGAPAGPLGMSMLTLVHLAGAGLALAGFFIADVIRPGSFARAGVRDVKSVHPIVWFAPALLILIAQQVGAAGVLAIPGLAGAPESMRFKAVASLGAYSVGLVTAGVLVRLIISASGQSGLAISAKGLLIGGLAFIPVWPIVATAGAVAVKVAEWSTGATPDVVAHDTLAELIKNQGNAWAWVMAGLAVVAAPVIEEIIYRGFLQSALLRVTGRPWVAIVGAAAIFALMHRAASPPVPWHAVGVIFVLGAACGAAFERSRNLGAPIMLHALFNLTNVVLALAV